jgi:hypothetical protein
VSELRFRGLLLGFRSFVFERRKGKCFVELARLIVLFRVGLGQLFVGFGLSEFPVGLPQFFVRAMMTGDGFVGLSRLNFFFALGLRNFCVGVALPGSPVGPSQFFV